MALNAFAIDAMIPALPAIGAELGVATENLRQLVVIAYFFGFGVGQIIWGPLADRFGRKPILAVGVALYTVFALLCGIAGSFELLIAGRIAMGASAAVTRVLVIAMVRDLFEGEAMARVMSLVFMVFMVVPVLAPNIGQGILLVARLAGHLPGPRRLRRGRCGCGAWSGCPKRCIPNIGGRSTRRNLGRREDRGDRPAVARLHAGADRRVRRR